MTDFVLNNSSGLWHVYEEDSLGRTKLGVFDTKTQAVYATEDLLRKESGRNRMVIKTEGVIRETITYIDGVEQ